jgi:hypothetical protein
MSGYANGTAVASAAAVLLVEESGELSGAWGRRWEPDQILDCIKRHPLLPLSVSLTKQTASLFHISAGVAGWLHYRFGSSDATLRDLFFDTLHTGKALGEADPVAALRNRLTKEAGARARLTQKDQAVLIIRAWNAVREGRRLVILKATIRGEKDYQFPAISGASPVGKAS